MENGSNPLGEEEILIDPEYALYDDDGNIIGQFDDDGNETYLPGKEPAPAKKPEENDPAGTKKPDSPEGAQEDKLSEEDKKKEEGEEDEEEEYVNHADYILKLGGYKDSFITLEDGSKVEIADLSAEQQLNLVTNEFLRMQQEFQQEIENGTKDNGLNEEEKALVDMLRTGATAKDLAQYILESDPDNAFKNLTDDELVLENIRKAMPWATEEDIQEELKVLKETGRFDKRAQQLREKLGNGEIKLADISKKHEEVLQARRAQEIAAEQKDAEKLMNYAKGVKAIANVPVDPSVINTVLKDLIPEKPGEDSTFLKSLNSPEKLLRLQFLDRYAEQILEHIANQSMKEGVTLERQRLETRIEELETQLGITKKHLSRFSDKPVVQFSKTNGKKSVTETEAEEETF